MNIRNSLAASENRLREACDLARVATITKARHDAIENEAAHLVIAREQFIAAYGVTPEVYFYGE